MTYRLPFLILLLFTLHSSRAQDVTSSSSSPTIPSPEEFVNDVYHTIVDSTFDHYYLITGADTCRFVKYDYDEWTKYYLKETVPFLILNELSQKAYLSRYPYYWKQDRLEKAICITAKKADSLLYAATQPKTPVNKRLIFSFSLPQFTDDGKYAVIDLNAICGATCGLSLTCLYKHSPRGWTLIGRHTNFSSAPPAQ